MPLPSIHSAQTAPPLPARSPHFVASLSASLSPVILNWSYIARRPRTRKVRRGVTGYPSMTVESHQIHFENVQKGLRKKLDAYRTEGCDDDDGDGGIPWDASIYATMITPSPSDWRPSGLSPSPSTLSAIAAALQSAATALETAF